MAESITGTVVAHMAGISYRQLDYLVRSGVIALVQAGPGKVRHWTPDQVHRLQVATALNNVVMLPVNARSTSHLPHIAQTVFAGPEPTGNWVALRGDVVSYGATVSSLFPKALDPSGAIVTRMPELWP